MKLRRKGERVVPGDGVSSQRQNAVGAGISSEVESPVPPTLKQAWLVGAMGLPGAAEAVSRRNRRAAEPGRMVG